MNALRISLVLGTLFLLAPTWAAERLTFESHVRPILKAHCFHCHGEEDEPEGSLDLRQVRLLLKGGDGGPAIVAHQPDASLLLQRVVAQEMPPPEVGKPLASDQIAILRTWIEQGAPTSRPETEQLTEIADDERQFWSFQPLGRPSLPPVADPQLLRSPPDAFLLAALAERQLTFSAAADRVTLVRRAAFDLLGLPPTPAEVDEFLADPSPDAYEKLLDRLLASPQYGERWGRHWLDVAGYADSDGYTEKDPERKYAYKYRDYVILALNRDKPWSEFLIEQLAGDELLQPPLQNLTAEDAERLAATGFLRMVPDGTADGTVDQAAARNDVIAESLKVVSTSLLGLTVGCAQCHNHRYDAIPQSDYYRFRAIFEPAYDPQNWRKPGDRLVSLWSSEVREEAAKVDAELKKLADERNSTMDAIVNEIFASEVEKLPPEQRELAKQARDTATKDRTPEQKNLLKAHPSLNVSRGSAYLYNRKRADAITKEFDARQKEIQARRPPEDFVPCLTEVPGKVADTYVFYRGDIHQPRGKVEPGELSVLATTESSIPHPQSQISRDDPSLPTSGRRLAYARWLTSGEQPLVPRVLVNRIWMHHFGRGIVATPADFGVLGARPSHPQLLDWLAGRFLAGGWQLKSLHRLLMTSAAYQQVATRRDDLDAVDPDNVLLGRMSLRRLEAEALRDSLLAVTGDLNLKMLGPPAPVTVDEVGQTIVGLDNRDSAGRPTAKRGALGSDEFRRSVYVQVRRSRPLTMLDTFDAPALNPNCEVRNRSTVAPQSLLLMNSDFVLGRSEVLAERILSEVCCDRAAQVRLAWKQTLGREPPAEVVESAVNFLAEQEREFAASDSDRRPADPAEQALANLCQALFSSNAFLYVD